MNLVCDFDPSQLPPVTRRVLILVEVAGSGLGFSRIHFASTEAALASRTGPAFRTLTPQGLFIHPEAPVGAVVVGFRAFRPSGGSDIPQVRLVLISLEEASFSVVAYPEGED